MRQTILTVIAEIAPEKTAMARTIARDFLEREDAADPKFPAARDLTDLHFMSVSILDNQHYDPLLVIELNFDGDPYRFWPKLEQRMGGFLEDLKKCTKDAGLRLHEFLTRRTVWPSAAQIGNVGLSVERIRREHDFVQAVQGELDARIAHYRTLRPSEIHDGLRKAMLHQAPWLDRTEDRLNEAYRTARLARWPLLALVVILLLAVVLLPFMIGWVVGLIWVLLLGLGGFLLIRTLRTLEDTDFIHDRPDPPPDIRQIVGRENRIVQNHLASTVMVKPGILRGVVISLVLPLLGFVVRSTGTDPATGAPDGYLGQMRTIHFAHWALVGNGGRLLFVSNFDGSWQSYLDDFVDKAAGGLTLAWSNCVGFPRTMLLYFLGATDGQRFKPWARHSQRESLYWYSAYPSLTVDQIERNNRIVNGLRKNSLTGSEARQWAALL